MGILTSDIITNGGEMYDVMYTNFFVSCIQSKICPCIDLKNVALCIAVIPSIIDTYVLNRFLKCALCHSLFRSYRLNIIQVVYVKYGKALEQYTCPRTQSKYRLSTKSHAGLSCLK